MLGASLLTNSARHIAKIAGISEFVIGATVVAFGTSLPELASSIQAMLSGHPGIVVGNVLGSNVANIGLALGLTSVLFPVYVSRQITDIDIPFLLASAVATYVVFIDLKVSWIEGLILISMYMAFIFHEISQNHSQDRAIKEKLDHKQLIAFFLGAALLHIGARYLISSALIISENLRIGESLIAFFLVAIGTSLPEIAATLMSAKSGRADIAMGNVLGSNTFNSLVVLGSSTFFGAVSDKAAFIAAALPAMILLSILLGFMSLNNRITRLEGCLLLLIYCALAVNLI
ncbi:MAG: calcium/sodium antiporter [Methanothrix sp.]|nr:calcium/sodium antiporter [Methanothrix sp.]